MFDHKELERSNFLTWLAYASASEIAKARKEHKEKFERLYKEYAPIPASLPRGVSSDDPTPQGCGGRLSILGG